MARALLIGRLLHDTKRLFDDQLRALEADSSRPRHAGAMRSTSRLVDGLAAEREQGITIDVAYRYFDTDARKFIVADCPATSSTPATWSRGRPPRTSRWCMVDARKGVLTQTRRHSYHRVAAGHPPHPGGGQQDGPGRLRPRAVFRRDRRVL